MSVSFESPTGTLDLNNGLAGRLLQAIGYKVGESNAGGMGIEAALAGIARAKGTLDPVDEVYLVYLEEVVREVKDSGGDTLTWF